MDKEPEPYRGPFVVMSEDADGFHVTIDPPTDSEPRVHTFRAKDDAWRAASDLWTAGRLPFRDLTTGRNSRWADD